MEKARKPGVRWERNMKEGVSKRGCEIRESSRILTEGRGSRTPAGKSSAPASSRSSCVAYIRQVRVTKLDCFLGYDSAWTTPWLAIEHFKISTNALSVLSTRECCVDWPQSFRDASLCDGRYQDPLRGKAIEQLLHQACQGPQSDPRAASPRHIAMGVQQR